MKINRIKIKLEDNIDLMDEYNNENILDNNSENKNKKKKKKKKKKKLMKIELPKVFLGPSLNTLLILS